MLTIDDLETPAVLIDLEKAETNLIRAQQHLTNLGLKVRPHIKTHKLPFFAKKQLALGAVGINCQKLGEAEVMADNGLDDILITYNLLGENKLKRLRALSQRITLSVTADNSETIAGLAFTMADTKRPLSVFVECDTGANRCGVASPAQALKLAKQIDDADGLHFKGIMTYPPAGGRSKSDAVLAKLRDYLLANGLAVEVITSGGTPDLWDEATPVATEYRVGTYIYMDRMQIEFNAAELDHCALSVLTTIVSRPTDNRAVFDAGSKALAADRCSAPGYGHIVEYPNAVVTGLNEEHGVVDLSNCQTRPTVGERVRVIPNHACVVSNLFDAVNIVKNGTLLETIPVAARGRVD